ncbi:MAG: hypothetical protein ABJ275_03280 [Maricaulaceae bacterium]
MGGKRSGLMSVSCTAVLRFDGLDPRLSRTVKNHVTAKRLRCETFRKFGIQ